MNNWPIKKLGEVIIRSVNSPKVKREDYKNIGKFPIIDQSQAFIAGYTDNENYIYSGELPVIIFGDHTQVVKYMDRPFVRGADGTKIINPNKNLVVPEFLFYILSSTKLESHGYSRHYQYLIDTELAIPPLNIQKKIVERLDAIRKAQELCDQQIQKTEELSKSIAFSAFKDGKKYKLGELFTRQTKAILPTNTPDKDFNFIGLESIESNTGKLVNFKISKGKEIKSNKFFFQEGNILYGKLRPYLNKVWLAAFNGICSTDIWVLQTNTDLIASLILAALLRSNLVVSRMSTVMTGTNLPRANASSFDNLEVTISTVKEQKKIVDKLKVAQDYKKLLQKQKVLLKELFDSVLDKSMKGEMDN